MTRDDLEASLAAEFGDYLSLAIAAGGAVESAALSAWLDWPIGDALRAVGYPATSYGGVIAEAVAAVVPDDEAKVIAVVRLRVAERIAPGLARYVNMKQGPDSQELAGLGASLDRIIGWLRADALALVPSLAGASLTAGRIRIGPRATTCTEVG